MQQAQNNLVINLLQGLPDFKGKRRLSRLLLKKYIAGSKDVILSGKQGIKFKVPNFIETVGFEILVNGIYEKESSDFIVGKIPANGVFFDIGANIGAVIVPVCKRRPDISAVCIEASPRVFSYLSFNTALNKVTNCSLVNNAIGEREGEAVSFYSPTEKFGKGSLSSVFTKEADIVTTVTIDQLVSRYQFAKVDLIKIDVEGYEYHAFKGGKALLSAEDAPDIFFEFVDWAENLAHNVTAGDAQALLTSYGYQLFNYNVYGTLVKTGIMKSGNAMLFATKKIIR